MATRTCIFVGGGTGGHIYPGVAVARELDRQSSGVRSLFVCSDRAIDTTILSGEGAEFVALGARPFGVRPRALVRFLKSWGRSVREARLLIRSEVERAGSREAVQIVAMGGFVAAPCVQAARVERVRVTLVNLDAVPGKANRMIAKRADRIVTGAPIAKDHSKGTRDWTLVPPIVRAEVMARGPKAECRARLGLEPERQTLLITGGSQGASSINRLLIALVQSDSEVAPRLSRLWQVIHQCGKEQERELQESYEAAGIRAVVQPFVKEMGDWWGAADLAVARSGAGNVGEAWANAVPCIFLPYPYHRDQHQKYNAAGMVEKGAAVVVTDRIEPNATIPEFAAAIGPLVSSDEAMHEMQRRAGTLGPADGAARVARLLLG